MRDENGVGPRPVERAITLPPNPHLLERRAATGGVVCKLEYFLFDEQCHDLSSRPSTEVVLGREGVRLGGSLEDVGRQIAL